LEERGRNRRGKAGGGTPQSRENATLQRGNTRNRTSEVAIRGGLQVVIFSAGFRKKDSIVIPYPTLPSFRCWGICMGREKKEALRANVIKGLARKSSRKSGLSASKGRILRHLYIIGQWVAKYVLGGGIGGSLYYRLFEDRFLPSISSPLPLGEAPQRSRKEEKVVE